MAELGYEPDAGARALRSGSTKTIGLIILDLRNPHFWENADGVEQEARAAGYRLLVSNVDLNTQYGEEAFKDLSGRRIDGLILYGLADGSVVSSPGNHGAQPQTRSVAGRNQRPGGASAQGGLCHRR